MGVVWNDPFPDLEISYMWSYVSSFEVLPLKVKEGA